VLGVTQAANTGGGFSPNHWPTGGDDDEELTAFAQFGEDPSVTTLPNVDEFVFEAFYNIQVTPQLNVPPDVQFINLTPPQDS
jgi:hypothetical protein